MLNIDGKGRCMQSKISNDVCECCLCDPCDCHGMNDELWRMGQTECHQRGQNTCMVGARNRAQSKSGQQVEEREHSTHSVFFEDLQRDCETAGKTNPGSHPRRGFLYWGFF